ncbi:MAG: family 20 glycosylhydrolase [Spirochaetales bacterium]|nr:family 20 glycosylhydrolase [Spirochaetales bacterium]
MPKKTVAHSTACLLDAAIKHQLDKTDLTGSLPGIRTEIDENRMPHDQGYILSISTDGIRITGHDEAGVFYGLTTLRQIAGQTVNGSLHCMTIEDWPDLPVRGVMIDISRDRVPKRETIFEFIDFLGNLKINQFQLYTEHTFAYKNHKKVWEKASPLTADEIRSIDAYCKKYFIDFVPNQNSFGHLERWFKHKEYTHLAETEKGFIDFRGNFRETASTLCPIDGKSIDFISGLFDELLANFTSDYFNVGCDETYDLGQGRSKELCLKQGKEKVYLDFIKKIHHLVSSRGKRMMFWGDIILKTPQLIPQLPRDIIALNWGYEADSPFDNTCRAFHAAGIDYYVCPGTSSWNSIGGRYVNAKTNILNAVQNGQKYGASGCLISEWGDNGHIQQYPIGLPAFIFGASTSWNTREGKNCNVEEYLSRFVFKDKSGLAAKALMTLQNICTGNGMELFNATLLFYYLYPDGFPEYDINVKPSMLTVLDDMIIQIEKARKELKNSEMSCRDCGIFFDEIDFTARLMLHACNLAKLRIVSGNHSVTSIPKRDRTKMAAGLELLIDDYKSLWNTRSREGGLQDSAGRLEKLLKGYRA